MLKNMTTSKWLTYIFTFAYIVQVGFSNFAKVKYNVDLTPLLNYTTPIICLVCTFYFGKSSFENNLKIKNGINQDQQVTSQLIDSSKLLDNKNKKQRINYPVAEEIRAINDTTFNEGIDGNCEEKRFNY